MSEQFEVSKSGPGIEIHGPFLPEWKVTFGGYHVPYISARECDGGLISVCIDNRFGMADPVSREEFDRWLPILAQAMAVAAGLNCHGDGSAPLNRFSIRMSSLGSTGPILSVVDGGKRGADDQ